MQGRDWGYKQGCEFAEQKCLKPDLTSVGDDPHFCADTSIAGGQQHCTLDLRARAYCDAAHTNVALPAGFDCEGRTGGD